MFLLGKWITWAKSCKELSSGFKHVSWYGFLMESEVGSLLSTSRIVIRGILLEWDIHLNFWLGVLLVQGMPLSKLELLEECATAIFVEEDDFRKS